MGGGAIAAIVGIAAGEPPAPRPQRAVGLQGRHQLGTTHAHGSGIVAGGKRPLVRLALLITVGHEQGPCGQAHGIEHTVLQRRLRHDEERCTLNEQLTVHVLAIDILHHDAAESRTPFYRVAKGDAGIHISIVVERLAGILRGNLYTAQIFLRQRVGVVVAIETGHGLQRHVVLEDDGPFVADRWLMVVGAVVDGGLGCRAGQRNLVAGRQVSGLRLH